MYYWYDIGLVIWNNRGGKQHEQQWLPPMNCENELVSHSKALYQLLTSLWRRKGSRNIQFVHSECPKQGYCN